MRITQPMNCARGHTHIAHKHPLHTELDWPLLVQPSLTISRTPLTTTTKSTRLCVCVAGVIELSSGNLWRHQIIIIISLYRKMTALHTPKVGAWHHHHHLWMVKTVLAGTQPQHCQQTKCVIEMRNGGRLAGCFMVYDGASEHFVCHFSVANAEPDYLRCVSWPCMYIAQCTRTRRASRFICIYIFP